MSTGFRSRSSRARSARVLSGLNPVDTDWSAFNYYRSKTTHQPNHVPTVWRQTRSSRQRTPSRTLLLRLEWLQERLVASASAKETSALALVLPAKRELPLRAQAPPVNRLQLSVPAKVRVSLLERTGNRSLDALRKYERSTERQHGATSKILAIRNEVDYQKALCSIASE